MYYSIKKRLLLGVICILLAALVPAGLYAVYLLRAEVARDARHMAMNNLRAVEWALTGHPSFDSAKALDDWAGGYEKATGIRVSYIVDGVLVADSQVGFERLSLAADHSMRPEIATARRNGTGMDARYSTTVNKRFLYAAAHTDGIPGMKPGVLRIAMPDLAVSGRLDRVGPDLALAFAGAFILACLLLGYALLRGFRYLDELILSAQAIGQGEYARRMPDIRCRELRPFTAALNGMAANIENHVRELAEEKNRLATVLDSMSEGVLVLNGDARLLLCNPAAERMFSGAREGMLLMEAVMNAALQEAANAALRGDANAPRKLRMELAGGRFCSASVIALPEGGLARLVLVFTDISERERLDAVRRDFVANVSHEMRTPLTSIRGYAELLRDDANLPLPTRSEFLDIIIRNAEHMSRMTDGLLALARTEYAAGRPAVANAGTEPAEAVTSLRAVLQELAPVFAEQGITVREHLPEAALPVPAGADDAQTVFRNLLDNAMKYGGGRIDVAAWAEESTVFVSVRDYGPGIPEESRERIFERFFRLERGTEGAAKATMGSAGLGLAICRHIMRNMGGSIKAVSPADGGAGIVFVTAFPAVGGAAA